MAFEEIMSAEWVDINKIAGIEKNDNIKFRKKGHSTLTRFFWKINGKGTLTRSFWKINGKLYGRVGRARYDGAFSRALWVQDRCGVNWALLVSNADDKHVNKWKGIAQEIMTKLGYLKAPLFVRDTTTKKHWLGQAKSPVPKKKACILQKHHPGYNLAELLIRNKRLTKRQKLLIAIKAVEEVRYLHAIGYIHGDLKPANIMVSVSNENIQVALIDFDFACKIPDNGGAVLKSYNGTYRYMAPEILAGKNKGKVSSYSKASDIYALGVVLAGNNIRKILGLQDINIIKEMKKSKPDDRPSLENVKKELMNELLNTYDEDHKPSDDELKHITSWKAEERFTNLENFKEQTENKSDAQLLELFSNISAPNLKCLRCLILKTDLQTIVVLPDATLKVVNAVLTNEYDLSKFIAQNKGPHKTLKEITDVHIRANLEQESNNLKKTLVNEWEIIKSKKSEGRAGNLPFWLQCNPKRKQIKIQALEVLSHELKNQSINEISDSVKQIKEKYPKALEGYISTRVKKFLDKCDRLGEEYGTNASVPRASR